MKWFLILIAIAIVSDLALGDPVNLHGGYLVVRQVVVNVASDIAQGNYQQLLHPSLAK